MTINKVRVSDLSSLPSNILGGSPSDVDMRFIEEAVKMLQAGDADNDQGKGTTDGAASPSDKRVSLKQNSRPKTPRRRISATQENRRRSLSRQRRNVANTGTGNLRQAEDMTDEGSLPFDDDTKDMNFFQTKFDTETDDRRKSLPPVKTSGVEAERVDLHRKSLPTTKPSRNETKTKQHHGDNSDRNEDGDDSSSIDVNDLTKALQKLSDSSDHKKPSRAISGNNSFSEGMLAKKSAGNNELRERRVIRAKSSDLDNIDRIPLSRMVRGKTDSFMECSGNKPFCEGMSLQKEPIEKMKMTSAREKRLLKYAVIAEEDVSEEVLKTGIISKEQLRELHAAGFRVTRMRTSREKDVVRVGGKFLGASD